MDTNVVADTGTQQEVPTASLLFVDDEQNILSSLRRLFRSQGYRIFMVTSGAEGLQILSSESIDLVISDMRMPEMDGAEFLEQVAKKWPDTIRILLTGFADLDSTIAAINKGSIYQYISKPWEDSDLKLSVQHALEHKLLEQERNSLLALTQKQNDELKGLNANLEYKVRERTAELHEAMEELDAAHHSLKDHYVTSIRIFANLVEMREGGMAGHSRRVAEQAKDLAIKMGMNDEQAEQVEFAGLLHDIGLIGVPDQLLDKCVDEMDAEERQQMMMHPSVGHAVLTALEPLQDASHLILHHHEYYDGSGYPGRLKGDDIPLGARILSLISDFDAAQCGRLFTERLSEDGARDYIRRHRGDRYDPKIVDAFLEEHARPDGKAAEPADIELTSRELCDGMVLARDLVTQDGILLLAKGFRLNEHLVNQIRKLENILGKKLTLYVKALHGE